MARFYFDFQSSKQSLQDDEGLELPDLETATAEASVALAECGKEALPGSGEQELSVQIRENDRPVVRLVLRLEVHPLTAQVSP